ncbi:MAG TPA: protealysin inhibitor emfourin [Anaerolineales bacterium]|nr:protealysin inhibitor emfourin [Anaerolineales bacterium]
MDIKRIKFERTGGFTGIRVAADFELDDLPEEQAEELRELLDDVDFDELPEQLMGKSQMADAFTYSITVEHEKGKHTVHTSDTAAPEKMQPLLELLYRIARQRAKKK